MHRASKTAENAHLLTREFSGGSQYEQRTKRTAQQEWSVSPPLTPLSPPLDFAFSWASHSCLGCWTCRARKVKCEESRPVCKNCTERSLGCDYAPRLKPQRRRRVRSESGTEASPSQHPSSTHPSGCSPTYTSTIEPSLFGSEWSHELPNGLSIHDWPIPLTPTDCQALQHYAEDFIPRMVLRTPRWSSYSFVLLLCSKHALLAHLVLAFSVRDMAKKDDGALHIMAIEHYRIALAMFIDYLGSSERLLWLTFPALWLFIHYEQQYGDDPRALQRHLEGVRDVVASHGPALFSGSSGAFVPMNMGDEERPRQIVSRLALWVIYHDASASTFGFGGSLIRLLNEKYPESIGQIRENSKSMIEAAWGESYPVREQLWDLQLSPLEGLYHECHLLRYELSTVEGGNEDFNLRKLMEVGRELKRLEKEYFPLLHASLLYNDERSTIQSNNYIGPAMYYALVITFERKVWKTRPSIAISKTLQACASLYEREGVGYLWRIAWPMFVAGLETDDLVYQTWIIERFTSMQNLGENLRRAKVVLEKVCLEQRRTGLQVDYLSRIKSGEYQGFVI
ncbi:uncharacterized protein PAC_03275 [Phialocephala subalpina]|uniref:Zn(2)-C6 fungal-type domain-containing protein n=1 Tax=Phialocephala subalpina TaxID=576137 RepID=A0A1L7WKV2_9HELO|nr:uncharacterized protein PAC_03275 [Phialocephala subalpina]